MAGGSIVKAGAGAVGLTYASRPRPPPDLIRTRGRWGMTWTCRGRLTGAAGSLPVLALVLVPGGLGGLDVSQGLEDAGVSDDLSQGGRPLVAGLEELGVVLLGLGLAVELEDAGATLAFRALVAEEESAVLVRVRDVRHDRRLLVVPDRLELPVLALLR